jgi:hypothetical protein
MCCSSKNYNHCKERKDFTWRSPVLWARRIDGAAMRAALAMSCKSDCWHCSSDTGLVSCPVNSGCVKLPGLNEDSLCGESGCIGGRSCPKVWLLWLRNSDDRLLDPVSSCKFNPYPSAYQSRMKGKRRPDACHRPHNILVLHAQILHKFCDCIHSQIPRSQQNYEGNMRNDTQNHDVCGKPRNKLTPNW